MKKMILMTVLLLCAMFLFAGCGNGIVSTPASESLFSFNDYTPLSAEYKTAAEVLIEGDVYWSTFGKVYHTDPDCHALNRSDELTQGTVEQAMEANRTRLCSYCAKRDGIEGIRTDDVDVSDYVVEPKENADEATQTPEILENVYWIKGDTAYHADPECEVMLSYEGEGDISTGSSEQALADEVALPCAECIIAE